MDYLTLKALHVGCVATSYALFLLRGLWMMFCPEWLQRRWVRIVPHIVDTVLLGSAVAMALMIRQYPFVAGWLTAKLLALLLYIVLGSFALKRGRTRNRRIAAWFAAQVVFFYIVAVALTRNPLPWTAG
ncbi:MAG: SirB2 family protein [Burkholderiales bacterium]|nr:SirB2 family protein [Burkholderiales bacterium]